VGDFPGDEDVGVLELRLFHFLEYTSLCSLRSVRGRFE
jgi:hypothetical protein